MYVLWTFSHAFLLILQPKNSSSSSSNLFFSRQFAFHVSFSQFGHSGSIFRGENLKSRSYFRRYKDGRLPPIFEKYPEPGFRLPHEYDNVSNLQNRYIWNCEPATAFFSKNHRRQFFFSQKWIFYFPKICLWRKNGPWNVSWWV